VELTLAIQHAFDSAGRQFDKTGKLTDWWTNDTIARYSKLTDCIVEQYAGYYVTGPDGKRYHINVSSRNHQITLQHAENAFCQSKFTLGEDIADGGGLAQTFRAWKDRFESDKRGEQFEK
jgi:endothelin-converting enzyme